MVEKRYYCVKHFNVAINMGVCPVCYSEAIPAIKGLSFSPYLGYLCDKVAVGITRDFTSISGGIIDYQHKTKRYSFGDFYFNVPIKIEGEFLRSKNYLSQNDYSDDEIIDSLKKLIDKYMETCTCYMCETSRVTV